MTFQLRTPTYPAEIAYVGWSPTSHSIAYVHQNDLYVVPAANLNNLKAVADIPQTIRVTQDGSDTVFNGVPDWVYEEEVIAIVSRIRVRELTCFQIGVYD